jgi:hypothetical protein
MKGRARKNRTRVISGFHLIRWVALSQNGAMLRFSMRARANGSNSSNAVTLKCWRMGAVF